MSMYYFEVCDKIFTPVVPLADGAKSKPAWIKEPSKVKLLITCFHIEHVDIGSRRELIVVGEDDRPAVHSLGFWTNIG